MIEETTEKAGPTGGNLRAALLNRSPVLTAYRLSFVANAFAARLFDRMEAESSVTHTQFIVMLCLWVRDDTTAQEIAEATQRPKNNLSRAVRALEAKGLIERRRDPVDQRRQPMGLSPQGSIVFRRLESLAAEQEASMLAPLTAKERETLTGLLMRIAATY